MKYDFDAVINRKNTNSLKYDFAAERGKPDGLLPMWVADMDFPAPVEVLEDMGKIVERGVFGYTEVKDDYYEAVGGWFGERFGYSAGKNETVKTPGVVFALAMAVRAFTKPGDGVIIHTPVYYPFFEVIRENGAKTVENPLIYKDNEYLIDFGDFEDKIKTENVKLFLLCSPHNPVGRVWTGRELERLNEICAKHGVVTVSDEIHCDFVWEGHKHVCFGTLNEDAVIATSPSKSFNLAGLQTANIFIKNAGLRRAFKAEIGKSGYSQLNALGLAACQSAYTKGGEWLERLKEYISGNIGAVREFLAKRLPKIKLVEPEGTYLLWLDFSEYGLSQARLDSLIVNEAKLWLDCGTMFGANGEGFQRINVACPKKTLNKALFRLEKAMGGAGRP
ncbi:MAG: pyridoxal phosphate-dependent aminotransferase [Oscillospiraceae bacterium]|jgi:cystathionine beta-lyase|nr:pyridoxal phosphate-dependent aminotransferase [Oscillospiraceae bacterium]